MRRILSILCVLVLGLGPAWAAIPTSAMASGWTGLVDESRLPACCRRHGIHHCTMGSDAEIQTHAEPNATAMFSAFGHCPAWPHTLASTTATVDAEVAGNNPLLSVSQWRQSTGTIAKAGIRRQRTWPKRGPPSSQNS